MVRTEALKNATKKYFFYGMGESWLDRRMVVVFDEEMEKEIAMAVLALLDNSEYYVQHYHRI